MSSADLGAAAFSSVIFLGGISGAASAIVFRRWSDSKRLRETGNRIVAHLLEIQLFSDEPGIVLRAQRDLIAANGQLLMRVARPSLLLLLPFAALLFVADMLFGHAPLHPGETTLVTVRCRTGITDAQLETSKDIRIETPPVFIPVERQLVWRVRAIRPSAGILRVLTANSAVEKSITAGAGLSWLSVRRSGSILNFLLHPGEWPFSSSVFDSIEVGYRPATVFHVHWFVWFLFSSFLGAGLSVVANHHGSRLR